MQAFNGTLLVSLGNVWLRIPKSVSMAQTWWTEELPNLGFSSPTEFQILVSGL